MNKIVSIVLLALFVISSSQKLSPLVLEDLQKNRHADIIVVLKNQVNFDSLKLQSIDHVTRGRVIVSSLMKTAQESQKSLLQFLQNYGLEFKSYWISNMVAVENVRSDLINDIASREDVQEIRSNRPFRVLLEKIEEGNSKVPLSRLGSVSVGWNIEKVKAPAAWAKGFKGKGFVIASADTGVQWNHSALVRNYRGYEPGKPPNHNYNWWDSHKKPINRSVSDCGYNLKAPCDDSGHGTHTIGTVVANNETHILGVAPEAKFITCRNMDNGVGRPQSYIECLQFFLAPTDLEGKNPNADLRPHAIGNSYGCTAREQCDVDTLKEASEALKAAGVVMSASSGNYGPACSSVKYNPGLLGSVITIGATKLFSNDRIADWSSKGPVIQDGSGRRKPDLVAPGEFVWSTNRGNRYGTGSGTSMSSPHISGAIAIVWGAKPELLRNVDATQKHLEKTALGKSVKACDSEGIPNNVYGYGFLDLEKAVN